MVDTNEPKRSSSADLMHLTEEYKILQSKIDKIGDFRFRVRGWALTLVLGLIVAGETKDVPHWLVPVACVILTILFFLLEKQQEFYQTVFVSSIFRIEKILGKQVTFGPSIGRSIAKSHIKRLTRWPTIWRRIIRHVQYIFYGVLLVLALGFFLVGGLIEKESSERPAEQNEAALHPNCMYAAFSAQAESKKDGESQETGVVQAEKSKTRAGDSNAKPNSAKSAGRIEERTAPENVEAEYMPKILIDPTKTRSGKGERNE